jgi:hypothetical protein
MTRPTPLATERHPSPESFGNTRSWADRSGRSVRIGEPSKQLIRPMPIARDRPPARFDHEDRSSASKSLRRSGPMSKPGAVTELGQETQVDGIEMGNAATHQEPGPILHGLADRICKDRT